MRCGPRTLKYISRRCLDRELSDEEADRLCLLGPDGTSPSGMRHALLELGFQKVNIIHDCNMEKLQPFLKAGFVAVAFICEDGPDSGHVVAVHHANDGRSVYVYDPDTGYREIPRLHWDAHHFDYEVIDGAYILHEKCVVIGYYPPDGCKDIT